MKLLSSVVLLAFLVSAPCSHASPLEKEMKAIGRNTKALGQQIGDAQKKDSSLKLLAELKQAAIKSKEMKPSKTKDLPQAEQEKFVADYRLEMDKLITEFGKIEEALKADKFQEASTLFNGLKQIKRDGHEKFAPED